MDAANRRVRGNFARLPSFPAIFAYTCTTGYTAETDHKHFSADGTNDVSGIIETAEPTCIALRRHIPERRLLPPPKSYFLLPLTKLEFQCYACNFLHQTQLKIVGALSVHRISNSRPETLPNQQLHQLSTPKEIAVEIITSWGRIRE